MTEDPKKTALGENTDVERRSSTQIGRCKEIGNQYETNSQPKRDISGLSMVAIAFNICNSWVALATMLAIAIAAGGTFTTLYGIIIVSVVYICVSMTLAELASVYPTGGGQYHFTSILAPEKLSQILSYICGLAATCSWMFLAAGVSTLATQLLLSLPAFYVDDFEPKNWQSFLVFQAINIALHTYNIFFLKKTLWIHEVGFGLSLVVFFTVSVTSLIRSDKASSSFVWDNFTNNMGWPDGVTFITGLATPASMFLGLDGAIHLADEALHPQRAVPKALMFTSIIGFLTSFSFGIVMCYSITDLDTLINTTMPIYELWRQATQIMQTASRMTWAFALDGALIGSEHLASIHPSLQVPVWSYVLNAIVVCILGCIYLGSTIAFNAVMGSSIILQMISFSLPAVLLMLRGRSSDVMPPNRSFKLPNWLGWIANAVVAIFSVVEIVFFVFPPTNPTSGSGMSKRSN
ncbi:amino acid permease-domain-containing protein [Fusarium sp. MPI-SDFR-AT-0072]|nr:amino acid permease-domain-containing protein [Fusarium sp. MPI-SDFR-AT-0072]